MMQPEIILGTLFILMVLLAYIIQKIGTIRASGAYRYSRAVIGILWFGFLFTGGFVVKLIYYSITNPDGYPDDQSAIWGMVVFFLVMVVLVTYYPSVRFIIGNATLTYKSILSTKVFDLNQPFTLTCYPDSGVYIVRQDKLETKISHYIIGWHYLLEEIEKQATAMEKIEKK